MAGIESEGASPGEEALREALAEHGEDLAGAIEHTDEVRDAVDTVVLTIASADEEDVEHVTEAIVNLVSAVDGLSTEESVALAEALGENGEDLASALETAVRLERTGALSDLVTLAETMSALEVDEASVRGMNRLLRAVGEAEQGARPSSLLDLLRAARTPDVRAGLGYLLGVVRAAGESLRRQGRGE